MRKDDQEFSKAVDAQKDRPFEAIEKELADKAKKDFEGTATDKASGKPEQGQPASRQDQPKLEYHMKGPGGDAVRSNVNEENRIRQAKALAERKKSEELEVQADRDKAGALEEAKRGNLGDDGRSATEKAQDAQEKSKNSKLLERAERLKFASELGFQAKSKDAHEK